MLQMLSSFLLLHCLAGILRSYSLIFSYGLQIFRHLFFHNVLNAMPELKRIYRFCKCFLFILSYFQFTSVSQFFSKPGFFFQYIGCALSLVSDLHIVLLLLLHGSLPIKLVHCLTIFKHFLEVIIFSLIPFLLVAWVLQIPCLSSLTLLLFSLI